MIASDGSRWRHSAGIPRPPLKWYGRPTAHRPGQARRFKRLVAVERQPAKMRGSEMKLAHSILAARNRSESSEWDLSHRKNWPTELRFARRARMRAVFVATAALSLISGGAIGQTTRTNRSAASTSPTIPSSSSTSANSPCNSSNPTSPCYSAKAPRDPCYSAVAPNQPCSTTTTPYAPTPSPPKPAAAPEAAVHAFTEDQARAQIEAKGYSRISRLRKDAEGYWRGKAEKDGVPVNVTLNADGNVTAD
jgi:hypothetical protein